MKKLGIFTIFLIICLASNVSAQIIVSKIAKNETFVNEILTVTISIKNLEKNEFKAKVKETISAEPVEPKNLIVCPPTSGKYEFELQPCYFLWENVILQPLSSQNISYKIVSNSSGMIFLGRTELLLENGDVFYSDPLIISVKEISYVCGNGVCESNTGENQQNCAMDCLITTTSIPPSHRTQTYIYTLIIVFIVLLILFLFYKLRKVS